MAKSKCQGVKVDGSQCRRNATTGDYCKTHSPDKDIEPAKPAQGGAISLEFISIADRAMEELKNTVTEGVRVQWMRLIFDCCKGAKEEQRLTDGYGDGTIHEFYLIKPTDKPRPPVDDDEPEKAVDDDSERVIN